MAPPNVIKVLQRGVFLPKLKHIAVSALGLFLATGELTETRAEQNNQVIWDLTPIYSSDEAWDADHRVAIAICDRFVQRTTLVIDTQEKLLQLLDLATETRKLVGRVYTYATLKADEDLRDRKNQQMVKKASTLQLRYTKAFSTLERKLASFNNAEIETFINQEPRFQKHAFFLSDIIRQRRHILQTTSITPDSEAKSASNYMFRHIQERVIRWPTVMLSTGSVAILNPASFPYYRRQPDPIDRVKVFNTYWGAIKSQTPLFAKALNDYVAMQTKSATIRGYDNTLEAALAAYAIPSQFYQTMIEAANTNLTSLHRLLQLKQRLLGLTQIEYQDIEAPISELNPHLTLSDAKSLNTMALAVLGEEYLSVLNRGFNEPWMHTRPQAGKRSGAYMQDAAYDVHPYILLSFNETYRDVGSFTHEWGHATHSVLAKKNNPFETSRYSPFLAEITAATNQLLLQDHMITSAKTDDQKLYYLHEALENIRTTFFYHSLLAKIELEIHKEVAEGKTLTVKKLNALNYKIHAQFLGQDKGAMAIDPRFAITWSMVPHFYNNFHIYQYATSIAGAASIVENFSKTPERSVENYLALLRAGGSDYPHILLKTAGVNLNTMQPYDALISRMNRLLGQAEVIATKMGL